MKWKNKGHEYDNIGTVLKGKKTLFIYGVGGYAQEILSVIENCRRWIDWNICLVDRDEKKQSSGMFGYDVISPEDFFSKNKKDYFVIVAPEGNIGNEIYELVITHGIEESIIFRGNYFLYSYLPIYFAYVHDITFFTSENILPSTICNLNCRDCLNFTPYIKKHIIENMENLKKDIDLFFNAVDIIYRFQITGGEPLLYKHIQEFIRYIDDNYRDKIIRLELVTNGTVIPTDDFCEFLRERDIYVFLDDYRMALKNGELLYKSVYDKFKKHNVNFVDNYVESWIRMYTPRDTSYLCERSEIEERFVKCGNPWSSIRNGRISACNYAMYAAKAGICIDEENENYDLHSYTPEKRKELIEFRTGYNEKGFVNFCMKCNGWTSISQCWCKPAIQEDRIHEME